LIKQYSTASAKHTLLKNNFQISKLNNMNKNKLLLIVVVFFISCDYTHQIKKDPMFTIGRVINTESDGRGYFYLVFEYKVDKKNYTKEQGQYSRCESEFIGKYFPVIYYKNNPKHSQMLVALSDFEKWRVRYPDSLSWTED